MEKILLLSPLVLGDDYLYTSGTTGSPKLLFHACDQEGERLAHRAHLDQIDESTVLNTVHLGLWTAIGYRRPLMVWLKGGCVVFDQSEDWAVNLGKFNETHVSFMSGMLDTVIRATSDAQAPPYRFKLSIGGGFVSMQQAQSVLKQLTPNFSISYASTELCSPALKLQIRQDSDIQWLEPVPGRESEIVNAHGRTCSPLEEGILRIRLNALDHDAYVADEEATQKVFRDGWFYPGDLAVRRPDGRIRILGRVNDVINVNGNKYASAPIESKIQSILSVRAACVFNGTDSKGVNHLMVVVENDTPVTTAQIKEVKEQLPLLDRASFFQTDKLPVNSTGTQKVDRRRLREHILREKFK